MKNLSLERLTVRFAAKTALKDVDIGFERGKIHVLLGENGAGKSTLASVISGSLAPSGGKILADGKEVRFSSAQDAGKSGVFMVHQRPLLAKDLSVWENVVLGAEPVFPPRFLGLVRRRRAMQEAECLAARFDFGVPLDASARASALSADCVFFTAFLSALYRKPDFLVLDEPCAPLDDSQRRGLYRRLRQLADAGAGIIVITHNVREATEHSDRVSVLRKGKLVFDGAASDGKFGAAAGGGFGAESSRGKIRPAPSGREARLFAAKGLGARPCVGAALFGVSFSVFRGEIVLIAGQREAGMETLEDVVTGMSGARQDGVIELGDGSVFPLRERPLAPVFLRRFGTGIVPFNRTFRASNPALTVRQVAAVYEPPKSSGFVAARIVEQAGISISPDEPAANLSGGMLQRLILARELYYKPGFLVLSEPFQGLDKSGAAALTEKLVSLAKGGTGILVLAADTASLPSVSARVYRLASGHLETAG